MGLPSAMCSDGFYDPPRRLCLFEGSWVVRNVSCMRCALCRVGWVDSLMLCVGVVGRVIYVVRFRVCGKDLLVSCVG